MTDSCRIGIIGGSGFYEFLEGEEVSVDTPYGEPSDKILLTQYKGKEIAFLPRHGKKHHLPPHKINYRANLFALKKLGVNQILAPSAVGSLKAEIEPGYFVIADQFVDKTTSRQDSFFDGSEITLPFKLSVDNLSGRGKVVHIPMAEPYCSTLRDLIIKECEKLSIVHHKQGTVLVIEGPRFSTKAESAFYARSADIINMTQCPEVVLASELEICYANISLVTDYDAGLKGRGDVKPVTAQEVIKTFKANTDKLKQLVLEVIKNMPPVPNCLCGEALKDSVM